jgi:hypothetical protein
MTFTLFPQHYGYLHQVEMRMGVVVLNKRPACKDMTCVLAETILALVIALSLLWFLTEIYQILRGLKQTENSSNSASNHHRNSTATKTTSDSDGLVPLLDKACMYQLSVHWNKRFNLANDCISMIQEFCQDELVPARLREIRFQWGPGAGARYDNYADTRIWRERCAIVEELSSYLKLCHGNTAKVCLIMETLTTILGHLDRMPLRPKIHSDYAPLFTVAVMEHIFASANLFGKGFVMVVNYAILPAGEIAKECEMRRLCLSKLLDNIFARSMTYECNRAWNFYYALICLQCPGGKASLDKQIDMTYVSDTIIPAHDILEHPEFPVAAIRNEYTLKRINRQIALWERQGMIQRANAAQARSIELSWIAELWRAVRRQ